MNSVRQYRASLLIVGFIVITTFVYSSVFAYEKEGLLTVAFLDVGQGDAIFIETPRGNQMLIDGGRNASVLRELSKVMSFSDRTIDVVMASHPDADHIAGLIGVFNRYVVGAYFDPGVMHDTAEYKTLLEKVHEEGVTVTHARKGTKIYLDKEVYVDILFPDRDVSRVETNLGSIVLRVVYRETEILLTGDSPKSIEEYLVSRDGNALGSDILKVGHHGSKTSSAEDFVKAVNPEYAIISAGKDNSYGHPHKEVVELLKSRGIRTMSTGDMGTIVFESDGLSLVYKKR